MVSTGGLEPPQLSPHAPQACVSTIPPHRLVFFKYRRCAGCCLRQPSALFHYACRLTLPHICCGGSLCITKTIHRIVFVRQSTTRLVFEIFVIFNCHFPNTVDVRDVAESKSLLKHQLVFVKYSIINRVILTQIY